MADAADPRVHITVRIRIPWISPNGHAFAERQGAVIPIAVYRAYRHGEYFTRDAVECRVRGRKYLHFVRCRRLIGPLTFPPSTYETQGALPVFGMPPPFVAPPPVVYAPCGCGGRKIPLKEVLV